MYDVIDLCFDYMKFSFLPGPGFAGSQKAPAL